MFLISDLIKGGFLRDGEEGNMPGSSKKRDSDDDFLDEEDIYEPGCSQHNIKKNEKKVHKCTYEGCNASFLRPYRLKNHLLTHQGEKKYKCSYEGCDKSYSSNSHLKRHQSLSHCSSQSKTTFPCKIEGCGKVLKTADIYKKHMFRAHSEHPYHCTICAMTFREEYQLDSHYTNRHAGQKTHRCDKCRVTFLKLRVYNRHMRQHRIHICSYLSCYYSTDDYKDLRKHISSQHPTVHSCYHCDFTSKRKYYVRKHMASHLIKEGLAESQDFTFRQTHPYVCQICDATLTTKQSLERHVCVMHQTPKESNVKRVKTGSERARRKDKGVPKRSAASTLVSLICPPEIEKALINKKQYSRDDDTSKQILQLMQQDLQLQTQEKIVTDNTS